MARDQTGTQARAGIGADLSPQELVSGYVEPVYRFAAMLCPNPSDGEDLAQDALIRALQHRQQYDPARGELRAWLWRIVVNVARDQQRAARRATSIWERLLPGQAGDAEAASAESLALQRIEAQALLSAIHRLSRRHRTLIALRFGAGLRYGELAEVLGISEGAATQALRRALAALRRVLEERDQEPAAQAAAESEPAVFEEAHP